MASHRAIEHHLKAAAQHRSAAGYRELAAEHYALARAHMQHAGSCPTP